MQAIILAAGTGSRLKDLTETLPKALIEVGGQALLTYALEFAKLVGCTERIVVVGAYGDKVIALLERLALPNVKWVRNTDYLLGNLYSLGAARSSAKDSFLLMNTDHVYDRRIAQRVQEQAKDLIGFCDTDRQLGADDMKVALDDEGRIQSISKQLSEFDRGYVGMTFCPADRSEEYWQAFDAVAAEHGDKAVVEMVLGHLAKTDNPPGIGDISGFGWLEIDTQDERDAAEKTITDSPERFPFAQVEG